MAGAAAGSPHRKGEIREAFDINSFDKGAERIPTFAHVRVAAGVGADGT